MPATGDFTPAAASSAPDARFQVERVEWTSDDRLEVVGRWYGVRGRRFLRPMLEVEMDGNRRRLLALLEHKPWVAEEGEQWVAAFGWEGEPVEPAVVQLAVAPGLVVRLPSPVAPGRRRGTGAARGGKRADRASAARTRARRDGASAAPAAKPSRPAPGGVTAGSLEAELVAARAEIVRLDDELGRLRATQAAEAEERRRLTDELERVRAALGAEAEQHSRRLAAEQQAARRLTEDLREMREQIAAVRAAASRHAERLQRERDAAATACDAALAETERAERDRDAARRAQARAERERDAAIRARDNAREERNTWLSRARAGEVNHRLKATPKADARATAEPPDPKAEAPRARADVLMPRAHAQRGRADAPPTKADSPRPEGQAQGARSDRRPARVEPLRLEPKAAAGRSWMARLIVLAALVVLVVIVAVIISWAV
jgi:hypothetical protein